MTEIVPHLWFDTQAVEAAGLYTDTFPDSVITDVTTLHEPPSGDVDVVSFELCGQPFMAISAGPQFTFNPSVSFNVSCDTVEEVEALWGKLSEGGAQLMPLDRYPFSERYGWTEDRYGLSWQVMHDPGRPDEQRITPTLMFVGEVCGQAEEAFGLYTSVFPNSKVGHIHRYGPGEEPDAEGTVRHVHFWLEGLRLAAMDSALDHAFAFNEAISFLVHCDSQDEIDHYWDRLSAVPEAEQCGWLEDRYGVSWQVSPSRLDDMLRTGSEEQRDRVTRAFLVMKKLDIAELQRAFEGAGVGE